MVVKSKIPVAPRVVVSTNFLSDIKKYMLIKSLIEKSTYEAALEFGFDKHYKSSIAMKRAVNNIWTTVKKYPERYSASPEVIAQVQAAMDRRKDLNCYGEKNLTVREKRDIQEEPTDIKALTLSNRQKAGKLLSKKLDRISSSNKRIDEVNISSLAQVFGILFDKSQIIQGESTENIAIMAKIDENMTPQAALDAVLKMRERTLEDKDRKIKK